MMRTAVTPLRPRQQAAHHADDRAAIREEGGAAALDQAQRRADAAQLSGSHLPVGAERRQGHAVQLDAESLPRLHARLPLLLRAPLPDAVRARARRRVLVGDLREDEPGRRAADASSIKPSWTREQVAVGTATDPYQPIEGHYKLTRRVARGAARRRARRSAWSPRGRWSSATRDLLAEHRPARRLHRLHERADRRRGRLVARSSPAPRIRCSGCARSGSCAMRASTPAC